MARASRFALAPALAVLSLAAGAATAQELGVESVGGAAGLVRVGEGVGTGLEIAGRATVGRLGRRVRIVPELSYWSVSRTARRLSAKNTDLALRVGLLYGFGRRGRLSPYAGGGLGLHRVHTEASHPVLGTIGSTKSRFAVHAAAGVGVPLGGRAEGFGEVRYVAISGPDALTVRGGIRYRLR